MDVKFVSEIFLTVAFLLVLTVPCFILVKMKFLGRGAESALSAIVLYVCQPLMLFTSFQKAEYSADILVNMAITAALAVAVHALMFAVVTLCIRGGAEDKKKRVLKFTAMFSNCGYMGIPFLQMLYGDNGEILVYAGVVIGVFNIFAWTLGAYMMTGDKKSLSVKKAVLNPNIIGLALGVIAFIAFKKPLASLASDGTFLDGVLKKLSRSLIFFADMVTPLSMSVIGMKLAGSSFKKVFTDGGAYFSALFKLVVMALAATVCVAFLPVSQTVKNVVFFTLSMPSATMSVLLAVNCDGDADSATDCVILSTILSVASVPLVYMLFSAVCV